MKVTNVLFIMKRKMCHHQWPFVSLMHVSVGWMRAETALCDTDANKRGRDLYKIHHHTCQLYLHQHHIHTQTFGYYKKSLFSLSPHVCMGVCECRACFSALASLSVIKGKFVCFSDVIKVGYKV